MAWTSPMTAVAGAALSAANFNTYVRDNLNETAPAVASTMGNWFCSDAANSLTERSLTEAYIATDQETNSSSYTNLSTTGPSVTVVTGTFVIVSLYAAIWSETDQGLSGMSFAITGATTYTPSDDGRALLVDGAADLVGNTIRGGVSHGVTVTAGTNTFTAKYRTGTAGSHFLDRRLSVWCF